MNKELYINAKIINNGININLLNNNYQTIYPNKIWKKTSQIFKIAFLENFVFAICEVVPIILNKTKAICNFKRPILENLFFRNQLYDLTDCEKSDGKEHLSYIKKFYNLEWKFKRGNSTSPNIPNNFITRKNAVIVPFTFGKESLVTVGLCKELGIKPILVYCEEPAQMFERDEKLKLIKKFTKELKHICHYIKNEPGLFRDGKAFKVKRTWLGWGVQTSILAIMMLPFAFFYKAKYILFGSEYSNNEVEEKNGWKVFLSYDQTDENTQNQNNMVRLLSNNQCEVKTSLEPLDEISIFYILHHRYPELGKYQSSCLGDVQPFLKNTMWCHKCYKCIRMFIFARATGIDPYKIGFKHDLLNTPGLLDHYFGKTFATGSTHELDFAFYAIYKRGIKTIYTNKFIKNKLPKLRSWKHYINYYTTLKPESHLPDEYQAKLKKIFNEELQKFRKELNKI